jgi:hypothetical protein
MAKKQKIHGPDVAALAKKIRLEDDRRGTGEMGGKKSHFIPARLDHLHNPEDLEQGQVIGVLDTELAGDETDLPPGKYNVFLRKGDDGEWEAVAETDGRIVSRAARVTVRSEKEKEGPGREKGPRKPPRPEFKERGWCWWACVPIGPFWVWIFICW